MLSECARATTSAAYRHRIAVPNSRPRSVTVVALDEGSEDVVVRLAAQRSTTTVYRTAAAGGHGAGVRLRDLSGRAVDAAAEIAGTHLVVMIASAGAETPAAQSIGELCRRSGVMATALVLGPDEGARDRSETLAHLRPHAGMLVTTSSPDYVADLLAALRA